MRRRTGSDGCRTYWSAWNCPRICEVKTSTQWGRNKDRCRRGIRAGCTAEARESRVEVQAAAGGLRPASGEFCTKRNVSDSRRRGSGVRLVIRQMRMKAGFEDTRMETAGRCVSVRVELVQNRLERVNCQWCRRGIRVWNLLKRDDCRSARLYSGGA